MDWVRGNIKEIENKKNKWGDIKALNKRIARSKDAVVQDQNYERWW